MLAAVPVALTRTSALLLVLSLLLLLLLCIASHNTEEGYLNGRLTVVAGERFSDILGHSTGIKSVEWYNPVTDCWTDSNALFDLPYPRFRCSAAVFPEQNRIFVFGGQSPAINGAWPLTDDVFVYEETDADAVGDSSTPSTGSSAALHSSSAGAVAAAAVTALLCLLA
jgi:hypothetical protein